MELYGSDSNDSDHPFWCTVSTLDFTYQRLSQSTLHQKLEEEQSSRDRPSRVQTLLVYNNQITELPQNLCHFHNLRHLDVSNNSLKSLPEFLTKFPLVSLNLKNNRLENDTLPKSFTLWSRSLKRLHLGGNSLRHFPGQCLELENLQHLYIGSNLIQELPRNIDKIARLSVLSLGGNRLSEVPATVGNLKDLEVLVVSDNVLESLPSSIASLKKLKTLQLHKNRLRTLPTEIITLKCLSELSLRDNPLVVKFVNDMTYNPASLLEISARTMKLHKVPFSPEDLPKVLSDYLDTAHHCLNPKCNGVFFDNRVEHIKFVDFCGKYRVPLIQYLCSSKCVDSDTPLHSSADCSMMRKVLLG